jgi:hypothetical protein
VVGPPGGPERPSSLLIRRAGAAGLRVLDGSKCEADCNMAQAFEIPTGRWSATGNRRPTGAIVPGSLSRSPLPAGADPFTGSDSTNMGPRSTGCKHADFHHARLPPDPIAAPPTRRSGDPSKVNRT